MTTTMLLKLALSVLVLLGLLSDRQSAYLVQAAKRSILSIDNDASWTLVPREAEIIRSIADLTDGVYSLELDAVRPHCVAAGGSRRGMYYNINNVIILVSMIPSTWDVLMCRLVWI